MADKGQEEQVFGEDGGGKGGGGGPPPIQPLTLPLSADELAAGSGAAAVLQVLQTELASQRDRAQRAEAEAAELRSRLPAAEASLKEAREALDEAERRRQIDALLAEADAIDLEAARLLTELWVRQSGAKDVAAAVAELKRAKPFLFRRAAGRAGAAMSAASVGPWPGDDDAAEAARSGDRGALLRYLRARRGG